MHRIALVGAGPNAAGHAKYFLQNLRTRVVSVVDPKEERARILARDCGAVHAESLDQALEQCDIAVISSPNHLHYEHAMAAIERGVHLYCEKPFGLNLAEALALRNAVRAHRVACTVGYAVRFGRDLQTVFRYYREDRLGKLRSLTSRRMFYMDPAATAPWRNDMAQSGGVLYEINIHELDWMCRLGGPVRSVFAKVKSDESTHPRANDHLWVTLEFEGGSLGVHEGSWRFPIAQFYRCVQGSHAGLTTDEWSSKLMFAETGKDRVDVSLDSAFDLRNNLIDTIDGHSESASDAEWSTYLMAVAEAIFESSASGAPAQPQVPA